MSDSTSTHRLAELNTEIDRLEGESKRLESERQAAVRQVGKLARRCRYLRFLRWLRAPAASLAVWPMLVLTIGPFLVGVLTMIVVDLVFNSRLYALGGLLLGAAFGAGLFAMFLYRPSDSVLSAAIPEADSELELAKSRLEEAIGRCAAVNGQLKSLIDERHELTTSDKLQRAMLLQRNWKAMRDDEWEDYLAEVCRTLGASVDRSGQGRGEGVDMIVHLDNRRIAVAAQGEGQNVNSASVKNVITARDRLRCDACAVIINRRFTGAAQDFAQRNGCNAIGAEEFPDFVMGKIAL